MKPIRVWYTEEGLNPNAVPEYMGKTRRFRIEYRDPSSGYSNFEGVIYMSDTDPDIFENLDQICDIIFRSYNDPRKETTMTDLNQVPQNAEVTITDMPEFLRKLQEDGEVTVQTAADVDGKPVPAETPTVQ